MEPPSPPPRSYRGIPPVSTHRRAAARCHPGTPSRWRRAQGTSFPCASCSPAASGGPTSRSPPSCRPPQGHERPHVLARGRAKAALPGHRARCAATQQLAPAWATSSAPRSRGKRVVVASRVPLAALFTSVRLSRSPARPSPARQAHARVGRCQRCEGIALPGQMRGDKQRAQAHCQPRSQSQPGPAPEPEGSRLRVDAEQTWRGTEQSRERSSRERSSRRRETQGHPSRKGTMQMPAGDGSGCLRPLPCVPGGWRGGFSAELRGGWWSGALPTTWGEAWPHRHSVCCKPLPVQPCRTPRPVQTKEATCSGKAAEGPQGTKPPFKGGSSREAPPAPPLGAPIPQRGTTALHSSAKPSPAARTPWGGSKEPQRPRAPSNPTPRQGAPPADPGHDPTGARRFLGAAPCPEPPGTRPPGSTGARPPPVPNRAPSRKSRAAGTPPRQPHSFTSGLSLNQPCLLFTTPELLRVAPKQRGQRILGPLRYFPREKASFATRRAPGRGRAASQLVFGEKTQPHGAAASLTPQPSASSAGGCPTPRTAGSLLLP